MTTLEELTPGARLGRIVPDRMMSVVQVHWHGTEAVTLTYRDDGGGVGNQLLYRDDEARLEIDLMAAALSAERWVS